MYKVCSRDNTNPPSSFNARPTPEECETVVRSNLDDDDDPEQQGQGHDDDDDDDDEESAEVVTTSRPGKEEEEEPPELPEQSPINEQQPGATRQEGEAAPNNNIKKKKMIWIALAILTVLVLAGLAAAGLGVALSNRNNDTTLDRTTWSPAPEDSNRPALHFPTADSCRTFDNIDGSSSDTTFVCFVEGFPEDFLLTIFTGCPPDASNLQECEACRMFLEDSVVEFNPQEDLSCNRCIICHDRISFDCSNIAPTQDCAVKDCDGNCRNADVVNPDAPEQADYCDTLDDGTVACVQEHTPVDFLLTFFFDCPPNEDTTTNVFECETCAVVAEDMLVEFDSGDTICNNCIVCMDSVSYDCSNLAAPGDACAVTNCDGECIGG